MLYLMELGIVAAHVGLVVDESLAEQIAELVV